MTLNAGSSIRNVALGIAQNRASIQQQDGRKICHLCGQSCYRGGTVRTDKALVALAGKSMTHWTVTECTLNARPLRDVTARIEWEENIQD